MTERAVMLVDGRPATRDSLDHVVLVNDGHFTAMQVRDGRTRGLDRHLRRLGDAHATVFGTVLDLDLVRSRMRAAVRDLPDCSLRLTLYEREPGTPTVLTVTRPPLGADERPLALTAVPWVRAFPTIKHIGTFPQIQLAREAARSGFDDALLVDPSGRLCETTIANVALVVGDTLTWPTGPALTGITWQLLELALPDHGYRTARADVSVSELPDVTAAVSVNSIGIAPIGRIDDIRYPTSGSAAARVAQVYDSIAWDRI